MKNLSLIVLLLIIALVAPSLRVLVTGNHKKPAIVKMGYDKAHCTAFVVSDQYAITAAHCILPIPNSYNPDVNVRIYAVDGSPLQDATVIINRSQADIVALKGSFADYDHLEVNDDVNFRYNEETYAMKGYPYMSTKLHTSKIKLTENFQNGMCAKGWATFGFSGSPVIDLNTGKAIGVMSAIAQGYVIFYPIISMKEMLHLE